MPQISLGVIFVEALGVLTQHLSYCCSPYYVPQIRYNRLVRYPVCFCFPLAGLDGDEASGSWAPSSGTIAR